MRTIATLFGCAALLAAAAASQTPAHDHATHTGHADHADHAGHAGHAGHADPGTVLPTLPGQAAFGAIAEVVRILESDPATDWSQVSIARLREHLVDMNEVTVRAEVREAEVPGGLAIEVTGGSRTLEAIRRMIPAHAGMMRGTPGQNLEIDELADGFRLQWTSEDPAQATRIRGLGLFGFLTDGDHHTQHHLAIARGAMPH